MRKKRKGRSIILIILIVLGILLIGGGVYYFATNKDNGITNKINKDVMIKLNTLEEVKKFAKDKNIEVNITYEYSDTIEKYKVISQSIKEGESIKGITSFDVIISNGKLDKEKLASDGINELGKIPIMMYHGIREKTSSSTGTVGYNFSIIFNTFNKLFIFT